MNARAAMLIAALQSLGVPTSEARQSVGLSDPSIEPPQYRGPQFNQPRGPHECGCGKTISANKYQCFACQQQGAKQP